MRHQVIAVIAEANGPRFQQGHAHVALTSRALSARTRLLKVKIAGTFLNITRATSRKLGPKGGDKTTGSCDMASAGRCRQAATGKAIAA